jgi:hypothetical protein
MQDRQFDRAARDFFEAANSFEGSRSVCARSGAVPDRAVIDHLGRMYEALRSAHEEASRADQSPESRYALA